MTAHDHRSTDVDGLPMLARWGAEHPAAPLVVALHGNGTSEHSMIEIAPWLPHGPVAYVAVRGPIQQGTGFCWFTTTVDGRPGPSSLAATCTWFLDWLDTEGDPERPVILLGFRDGVTLAGALLLRAPHRFAGGMLIYGALPAGSATRADRGRLAGMPLFLAHGDDDPRTPPELLARTWNWLTSASGAPVWATRDAGGRQLAGSVVGDAGTWLADRLDFLRAHGENPLPDGDEPRWPALPGDGRLPARAGDPPTTTSGIPQHQTSQNAPAHLQDRLWRRLAALDGVRTAPATVGVAGTRSLLVDRGATAGPDRAFLLPDLGEFAHQHPEADGSLHLVLPDGLAYDGLAKGWAVAHPLAGVRLSPGMVLVPGPRDLAELEIVAGIVEASHGYACGR
jgi:phospholipase/carboxylesterase